MLCVALSSLLRFLYKSQQRIQIFDSFSKFGHAGVDGEGGGASASVECSQIIWLKLKNFIAGINSGFEVVRLNITCRNIQKCDDFQLVDPFLLILSFSVVVNFSELVVVDAFGLPVRTRRLIIPEHTQSLLISSARPIRLLLEKLAVGVFGDELVRVQPYIKTFLEASDFVLLCIIHARLQKRRKQFKFLALLFQLVGLD